MALTNKSDDRKFISILADGKMHMTVPEGTPGAVVRTYETSDGKTGQKTEMTYTELIGFIKGVSFMDGEYGTNFQVTVQDDDGSEPICLSLGTASNFGEDFMKKILAVDMEKKVKIVPFSFDDEKTGKKKKGVTIYQKNAEGKSIRVPNFFYDAEVKVNINGYPEPKMPKGKKTLSKDEWKAYFMTARLFLIEKITEHFKLGSSETEGTVKSEVDNW